jgi:hypothetical protein
MTSTPAHSPAPWSYEYSPYTLRAAGTGDTDTVGTEIPAFEIYDAEGNKVFDTNEDTSAEMQEANARLATAALELLAALQYSLEYLKANNDGEHDVVSRIAASESAIANATPARRQP